MLPVERSIRRTWSLAPSTRDTVVSAVVGCD
jgi:hypothetical protein